MATVLDRSYEVKANLLLASGYHYDVIRVSYVNPELRKAFSVMYMDDHSEEVIRRDMSEPPSPSGWQFYFNNRPSEAAWPLVEEEYAERWLKR